MVNQKKKVSVLSKLLETKHVVTVEKFYLCCVLKGIGEKIEVGFFDYHEQNLNSL